MYTESNVQQIAREFKVAEVANNAGVPRGQAQAALATNGWNVGAAVRSLAGAPRTPYIVIEDGACSYPVRRADVDDSGVTLEDLRAMTNSHYGAWCNDVPVAAGAAMLPEVELLASGEAELWVIG